MENGWSGVIDAVDDSYMTTIYPHIHLVLGSIEVLEEVGAMVQPHP